MQSCDQTFTNPLLLQTSGHTHTHTHTQKQTVNLWELNREEEEEEGARRFFWQHVNPDYNLCNHKVQLLT